MTDTDRLNEALKTIIILTGQNEYNSKRADDIMLERDVALRENDKLRKALIGHRLDLHNSSKRPCSTCKESAEALGIKDKVPDSCAYKFYDDKALKEK